MSVEPQLKLLMILCCLQILEKIWFLKICNFHWDLRGSIEFYNALRN